MSGKHAPGPWSVEERSGAVVDRDGDYIEVSSPWIEDAFTYGKGTETSRANMRLIAAAPQMLRALHAAADAMTMDQCDGDCQPGVSKHTETCPRRMVWDAIITARGGSGET